jgi:signal transduction histidine kinase
MMTQNANVGGRAAQKGFLYQNSIAASHLFELMIAADRVWQVTTETKFPVDDILVERRHSPSSYYQVKCYEAVTEWTINRLTTSGIIDQFRAQLRSSAQTCRLVLSSPAPAGTVHHCAEAARRFGAPHHFDTSSLPNRQKETWAEVIAMMGSESEAFHFMQSYFEEPWPPSPDDIRDICLGRYRRSPYASVPGLWEHLRDIVGREAVRGKSLRRADLLALLDDRLTLSAAAEIERSSINAVRSTATPDWYVHRDEEFDLLSATCELLNRTPRNLLVMGDGGTGKSSFFSWMKRELAKDSRITSVAWTAEGGDSLQLIDTVNNALKVALNGMEPQTGSASSRIDRLIWYVNQARRDDRVLVVAVDHFESLFASIFVGQSLDKVAQARYSIFEAIARTRQCPNLMWVFFARSEYFFLIFPNEDSLRGLNMSWVRMQDFTDQQASQLLSRLSCMAQVEVSDNARSLFLSNAPRNPLKLILAFLNLHSAVHSDSISGEAVLRIQPWEDVFQQDFNSLDADEVQVVYAIASLMVTTARRAFTIEEIESFLAKGSDEERPGDTLRNVLHRIQETKHLLQQPVPGRYALYHENFATYVISRYGGRVRTPESVRQYEDFMAMFLHQAKAPLQALFAVVSRLADLENRQPAGTESEHRRRGLIKELEGALQLYATNLRSAEIFAYRDKRVLIQMLAQEKLSLRRVILRVAGHHEYLASSRRVRVRVELPHDEMVIRGDEGMVSTALNNVVDNAVKYSFRAREVYIRAKEEERFYVVEVSDAGFGILPEEMHRIFDPYYRAPQRDSRRHVAGTGIGLYVTKTVLDAMRGSIEVTSTPPSGSSGDEGAYFVRVLLKFPKAE